MVGIIAQGSVSRWVVGLGAVALVLAPGVAQAQFTQVDVGLPEWLAGDAAWGDYDNDGDLDILSGGGETLSDLVVNENNGGVFTPVPLGLPALNGSATWGDYDGDGDLDMLIAGNFQFGTVFTDVFENNGGVYSPIGADLPGVTFGDAWWDDYDSDGDLDVLVAGRYQVGTVSTELHENSGGLYSPVGAGMMGIWFGHAAWGDYDNDGDPDVLLTGVNSSGVPVTQLYENDGGVFGAVATGLPAVRNGTAAWGDYDDDGDLDLVLAGQDMFGVVFSEVYENSGGAFAAVGAGLAGARFGHAAWGDYDIDGDLDLALTGEDPFGAPVTEMYENDGGVFTPLVSGLPAVRKGTVDWGDYDDDGDLDLLVAGEDADSVWLTQVWRNDLPQNEPPVANAGGPYVVECRDAADGSTSVELDGSGSFDPDGDVLTFAWSASAGTFDDASLPQPTLDVTGLAPGTVVDVTLTVDDGEESDASGTTVEVQDTLAPVIACPAGIVQEAVGPAGNTVTYSPTATDASDSNPAVVCDPPSGSVFAPGTTTVVTVTATDAAGNSSQCAFSVEILMVLTVDDLLDDLAEDVEALGLKKGSETKLLKVLGAVQHLYSMGQAKPACVGLQIVINDVNKAVAKGEIDAEDGQALIDTADELRSMLGC